MNSLIITFVIVGCIFGLIIGLLAKRKKRNGWLWGVIFGAVWPVGALFQLPGNRDSMAVGGLFFFFWFLAMIVLAFLPFLCPKCKSGLTNKQRKEGKCPRCDQSTEENLNTEVGLETVSIGKRFVHVVIDTIGIYALAYIFGLVMGAVGMANVIMRTNSILLGVALMTVYYTLFETLFGRTLGKLCTGSVVVSVKGGKPSLGAVLLRSVIRFVPFEPLSVMSGTTRMWHDTWTKTVVVSSKSRQQDA